MFDDYASEFYMLFFQVITESIVGTSKPIQVDRTGWSMAPLPNIKPTRVLSKSYNMNNQMKKSFKIKRQV